MNTSGSCVRCSAALPAGSADVLCPTCRSAETGFEPTPEPVTSRDSATPAWRPDAETATFEADRETGTYAPGAAAAPPGPEVPLGFELRGRLGHGGMGEVYLAQDAVADRLVALKFVLAPYNPTAVERFTTEIRALARLDHPNIVRVLGHDLFRAVPYFTMEYAAGGALGRWMSDRGPLAPADAARVMAVVARAVHAAHEAGVLHRDLKPSNILLRGPAGGADHPPADPPLSALTPLVSDFGLAKLTDRDDGLTDPSGALGTAGYIPPEQVSRRFGPVDCRSDVYGLGATLYHLLTGRPPFVGSSPEVYGRIVNSPPERPRAIRPEIPLALEAVVVRCLEKRPADRYPTATALADDLERFLAGGDPEAPRLTRWRRVRRWAAWHRVRLTVAAAAVLAAVGFVYIGQAYRPLGQQPEKDRERPDVAAALRKDLAEGRTAHVLFESGVPEFLKDNWLIHPAPLGQNPTAGGACGYESLDPSLLAFLKDPGVDSYRVTAQLRVMRCELADPGKGAGATELARSGAGLFLGHVSARGDDGAEVHAFLLLDFSDFVPPEIRAHVPKAPVQPGGGMIVAVPDRPLRHPHFGWFKAGRYDPVDKLPSKWRVVQAEVRPTGVKFFWAEEPGQKPELLAEVTAEQLETRYAEFRAWLAKYPPAAGLRLPAWGPRAPFGVWSNSSAVAVRNVTVEPIR